jgi:hypothetical protein
MKRRLTFLAAAVVLADLLALGAVWHVSPTLSLTVGLVVPEVEQVLAPLYPEPVREDVAGGELHRPARVRSMLVLTSDGRDARAVARTLARRDIAVVVPGPASAVEISAYARALGVPVRIENAALFRATDLSTVAARAAHAWRLLRLSHSLLTPR